LKCFKWRVQIFLTTQNLNQKNNGKYPYFKD
jgi:hypothetical protein